ncbi:MAG: hypothetical protein Fur0018_10580 [Anaerolineales bacterium]
MTDALAQSLPTDIRFTWENLMEGSPNAYALIRDASVSILHADMTPQEASLKLQDGLQTWYRPAQTCRP